MSRGQFLSQESFTCVLPLLFLGDQVPNIYSLIYPLIFTLFSTIQYLIIYLCVLPISFLKTSRMRNIYFYQGFELYSQSLKYKETKNKSLGYRFLVQDLINRSLGFFGFYSEIRYYLTLSKNRSKLMKSELKEKDFLEDSCTNLIFTLLFLTRIYLVKTNKYIYIQDSFNSNC